MKQILDQLLSSGKGWLNDGGDTRKAQMKGMAQGGLAAGAMALLLGNKKMRKYGTKVAAVGGAAALLARSIRAAEIVAYPELGAEAINRLTVEDFPAIVVNDVSGRDLYEEGQRIYQKG